MKNIIILGSSAAGVTLIESIRANDQESEITLISLDGHYPYRRDQFTPFITNTISPEQVFCRTKDFYEKKNVKVVLDQKISRINVKRKKIFTENKIQFDYDVLIITDTPENRYPDVKGTGKSGVYGFKKLNDIDRIVKDMTLIETLAIQSDSFTGLQAAAAIAKLNKELIFISSQDDFLSRHFDGDALAWLVNLIEVAGIRLMRLNSITEILGDKDAKAIRLAEGKVFSAEAILFGEMDEDLRLFSEAELQMNNKIKVDREFKTNIEGIFALDQVCRWDEVDQTVGSEPVTPQPVLEAQAKIVSAVIGGQKQDYMGPLLTWEFEIKGLVISVIGKTGLSKGRTIKKTFDQISGTYKGLYIENNCIVGAVLVNAQDETGKILGQISEKTQLKTQNGNHTQEELGSNELDRAPTSKSGISTELIDN